MSNVVELIDRIERLQKKRDVVVSMLDDQISILRAELEGTMKASGIREAVGSAGARASWREFHEVKVADWLRFFQWVDRVKAWDVLQKRVTPTAVLARIKAGEKVPEVTVKTEEVLVITLAEKAKRSQA